MAARMALARPRVTIISSPVAEKVGHMVGGSFTAVAAAVALFQMVNEGTVLLGVGKHGFEGQGEGVAGALPKVRIDSIAAVGNDLARVEQVLGVEGRT